jgi:threonylcarbamoyladenosine tRNA methylthiotransferase MtaB
LPEVIRQFQTLATAGFKEVVLTGVHLGKYGRDLYPPSNLLSLLKTLEIETPIPRIRLSSLEPLELEEDLVCHMASSKRICNHLHIPLQSGDRGILEGMKRPYTPEHFRDIVEGASKKIPDLTLGMDVIVGFPGEGEEAFERSLKFLKDLPFTYLHVFPYSRRPGTPASSFPAQVVRGAKEQRSQLLRQVAFQRKREVYLKQKGKTLSVLVERKGRGKDDSLIGLSKNYIRVHFRGPADLINKVVDVKIIRAADDRAYGILKS